MIHRFAVGLFTLLLGACRESASEKPIDTADTHQRNPAPGRRTDQAAAPGQTSVAAVVARTQQRLRTVARSGNIDHDVATLLLEHYRGTRQLAEVERATGQDPVLRALADTLRREEQQQSRALGRLAARTHANAPEEYTRPYQEFARDVQAACDSAGRLPRPASGSPDQDFAAGLAAHLGTGLLLVQESIAHGNDPALIALAHRFHHDQLRHLRQVQAWSSTPRVSL